MQDKSKVALTKGDSRYVNITEALSLIEGDIRLDEVKDILIKVNFVSTTRQLASTHVDGVRALLDFLRPRYDGLITIAEGSSSDTFTGYRNFGYLELADEYDVQLVDLNRDDWVWVQVYDRNLRPMELRAARSVVQSDYRIAIGPPKTHDTVLVTLSLKNIVVGSMIRDVGRERSSSLVHTVGRLVPTSLKQSPLLAGVKTSVVRSLNRSDKAALHQGYPALNLNLYTLAKVMAPHLSVIDGYAGMEGSGPSHGDAVELRLAIASTDFLAADAVAVRIMGFDLDEVGYLHYCQIGGLGKADPEKMEVLGNCTVEECIRPFKPHPTHKRQLAWQIPDVRRLL
ncbi:MAG: DUF362 domain-containing protein [Anaerolineae bacterium]